MRQLPVAAIALAAAAVAPVAVEGGFTGASRTLFIGLTLCAIAVIYALDDRPLASVGRSWPLLTLGGLALLTMASGAWTIGDPGDAVRFGLVVASLAGVALLAAWVVRHHGVAWIAGIIAAVAAVEAAIGLVSLATHHEPWAQVIGGAWRPGGTFEYPPALAVLQVSALPIYGWALLRGGQALRFGGLAGAALALAVIATSESRLAIGLCVLLALSAGGIAWSRRPTDRCEESAQPATRRRALALAGLGIAALAIAVAVTATREGSEASEPVSGIDHGRVAEWNVAIDAAADRPLTGAGAETYALAASEVGGGETLYAHSMPLETWAELGPAGLVLVLILFGSVIALVWRLRPDPRAWLFAPGALAFLLANLVDWTWHLAGAAALWALALGALVALDSERRDAVP